MTSTTNHDSVDGTAVSPVLPPHDVDAANANDVRRFVYHWFTLFEHRAPAGQLTAHLDGSEPLSLAYPGATLIDPQGFSDWYDDLLDNTRWNFHQLSHLTVELDDAGVFAVAFDVDWYGTVTEESDWETNLAEHRFHFELRQRWRVAVHDGSALDNPFFITGLAVEARSSDPA